VANFSDAVFAIALTLLVVGIGVPQLEAGESLVDALRDLQPEIISFFISFIVIGFYWKGQHQAWDDLGAVDSVYITLNLAYLALIAFLPFPTALVGAYEEHAITVVIYAVTLAAASGMECVMYGWAVRARLLHKQPTPADVRHGMGASLIPVVVIGGSIPLALISPTLALVCWIAIGPLEALWGRLGQPAAA